MKNAQHIDTIDVMDHIDHAKGRIDFLCSMFGAVDVNKLMFNENGLFGLHQILRDIDDVLIETAEFINNMAGRKQKRAPARVDGQAEAPNPDQD